MGTCTFFGHRDASKEIEPTLQLVLIDLIENCGVDIFYVGNNGRFDFMVKTTLEKLKLVYEHIICNVVLAYIPGKDDNLDCKDYYGTVYPDGLEQTPRKYAIIKRNIWMIDNSEYVITYVNHGFGNAAKFKEISEKKGKFVVNLADFK